MTEHSDLTKQQHTDKSASSDAVPNVVNVNKDSEVSDHSEPRPAKDNKSFSESDHSEPCPTKDNKSFSESGHSEPRPTKDSKNSEGSCHCGPRPAIINKRNKRLIWQKPKKIKRYWMYAIIFHLLLIVVILMIVVDSYKAHPHQHLVDAAVVSSIPNPHPTHPQSKIMSKHASPKPTVKPNLLPTKQATPLEKQQAQLQKQWMQHQLHAEHQQLMHQAQQNKQQSTARLRLIDHYEQLIINQIEANWIIPAHVNRHLSCIVALQLAPNGQIVSAHLAKSSGDARLDASAMDAVKQSSPLPVPNKPALFNLFKQLRLTLRPEKIVHQ